VLCETFAEQRSVDTYDVVSGGVIMFRSSEDLMSELELVDIVNCLIQYSVAQVEE
jgi:hypothetical protein